MKSEAFSKAYQNLNTEQKKAVDTIEGPVMVIAGPGTGKTSILTLRIANILQATDTPPNGILALTFTESGVHSMRKKLVDYIGPSAYRVHIYTFHGFAQEIISRYPEFFPRIIGGVVAGQSELYNILEEAILEGEYEYIRPFGKQTLYVRPALKLIGDLKRDAISPEQFLDILIEEEKQVLASEDLYHDKGRFKGSMKREYAERLRANAKNRELATLYGVYEKTLRERSLYDFADMLLELVNALKAHPDLLRTLQEEYLYILADEHQDANNSQNAILELLSDYRDTQNLFIVGDEKQAIYRFQGASLENFLYFQKKYPDATVIFLDSNYRSTQTILDASHALMVHNAPDPKLRPRLTSSSNEKREEKPVDVISYETEEDEKAGVSLMIQESISQGFLAEDIAILVRTNAEISLMGRALEGFGVPHTLFTDDNVLSDLDIGKLILLLRAVVAPENDSLVGSMLFIDFLGIHPVDAVKLNRLAHEKRLSPLDLLSRKELREGLFDGDSIDILARNYTKWIVSASNESVIDLFLSIINETKFQEYLLSKKESLEKIEKLAKLYDEVKVFLTARKDATLKDFMDSLETLSRHQGSISFSRRSLGARGVAVMTAHKSKGLEWKKVFIVNASDGVWGNRRSHASFHLPEPLGESEDSERNEDERRLFYVAMTRAKENVIISYSKTDGSGKDRLMSQFVEELPSDVTSLSQGKSFSSNEKIKKALTLHESDARTVFDKDYLRDIFLDQGLNATALNNYLECSWKYFFKNLARLPDVPEPYLHFGNSIHAALKAFADAKREGRDFSIEDAVSVFEKDLTRRPLSRASLSEALLRGKEALPVYLESRSSSWHSNSFTEYAVEGAYIELPTGENLLLRGRLDKVELINDKHVNVVDYKTGGFKTRNDILGNTKTSNGNIKRQLDFYRLLLERHDKGKFEMVSGTIEFVEPDEKGRIHSEVFDMTHEDAATVSSEVIRVAGEILNFSFWDKKCDDPKCEYCELRKAMLTA